MDYFLYANFFIASKIIAYTNTVQTDITKYPQFLLAFQNTSKPESPKLEFLSIFLSEDQKTRENGDEIYSIKTEKFEISGKIEEKIPIKDPSDFSMKNFQYNNETKIYSTIIFFTPNFNNNSSIEISSLSQYNFTFKEQKLDEILLKKTHNFVDDFRYSKAILTPNLAIFQGERGKGEKGFQVLRLNEDQNSETVNSLPFELFDQKMIFNDISVKISYFAQNDVSKIYACDYKLENSNGVLPIFRVFKSDTLKVDLQNPSESDFKMSFLSFEGYNDVTLQFEEFFEYKHYFHTVKNSILFY